MNVLHVEDQEDQFLLVEAAFEIAGVPARHLPAVARPSPAWLPR